MDNVSFEEEMQKLADKMLEDSYALFKKYDAIPSQGLDKQGKSAELQKLVNEYNKKQKILMGKYGVKEN